MNANSPFYAYLTSEENILIRSSCVILSEESKLQRQFVFWGKIFGLQNDYYVVQSTTLHPYQLPVTQYSRDGRSWSLLPTPPDALLKSKPLMSGLLTGDPMTPFSYSDFDTVSKVTAEPILVHIKEEDRLAYLVRAVDSEGTLVPKHSFAMNTSGHLIPDPMYKGMSYEECCNFENYSTFVVLDKSKPPRDARGRNVNALQPLVTVMPEILTDRSSWRFQDKGYENYVILYNTNWPGLFFYHAIDGSSYGRFYFGRGYREINVPFLLGTPGDDTLTVDIDFLPDYDFHRTPEEAERAKIDAMQEFFVTEGEEIDSDAVLSGEEDLSQPLTTEPVSTDGESHDETSLDPDADDTSGDMSATDAEVSDLESTG